MVVGDVEMVKWNVAAVGLTYCGLLVLQCVLLDQNVQWGELQQMHKQSLAMVDALDVADVHDVLEVAEPVEKEVVEGSENDAVAAVVVENDDGNDAADDVAVADVLADDVPVAVGGGVAVAVDNVDVVVAPHIAAGSVDIAVAVEPLQLQPT